MGRRVEIDGVPFEIEQRGLYVHYTPNQEEVDVMITRYDQYSYDITVHDPATGEVKDSKDRVSTKEACVRWAINKGYLTPSDARSG